MSKLHETNKLALQYALSMMPRMKEISAPLQKYMGIRSFSYMRIYNDCSYLSLLNGYEEFNKIYFETIEKSDPHFIQTMQNTIVSEPQFSLWPTERKNLTPIFSLLEAYDIWHGFQITYRKDGYCEMFSFTFDRESDDKREFFLKNALLLLKFVDYFRSQSIDIIGNKDKNKLAVFPQKFTITQAISDDSLVRQRFLSELDKPLLLKGENGYVVKLTKRETECLKSIVSNKTAKEAANILGISPRTIELHISNIKQKLGISYKNQLLNIYHSIK